MSGGQPIIRLKPGGHDVLPPARSHLVDPDQAAGGAPLREWHTLTDDQRHTAWVELVGWVGWLYDRYELATEHRLPDCWAQHSGLIEELTALRVWREQIYTADQPSGQAARYWHAELRQIIHAATTIYAKGCRAGHRAPAPHAADQDLRTRWLDADPLVGVPPELLTAADRYPAARPAHDDGPREISADEMQAAIDSGHAQPIGRHLPEYRRYHDAWWTPTTDATGWQQITDPVFIAELDAAAHRLRLADEIAERDGDHAEGTTDEIPGQCQPPDAP